LHEEVFSSLVTNDLKLLLQLKLAQRQTTIYEMV